MTLDPRTTPVRDGLASLGLEGLVRADRYVAPTLKVSIVPAAGVLSAPDAAAEQVDQVLFGEGFEVLDEVDGYAWGQAGRWARRRGRRPIGSRRSAPTPSPSPT
jgi:hypothetical protein